MKNFSDHEIPEILKNVNKNLPDMLKRYEILKDQIEVLPLSLEDELSIYIAEIHIALNNGTKHFHPKTKEPLEDMQDIVNCVLEYNEVEFKRPVKLTKAKLIKRKTNDKLLQLNDDIPLNKNYIVDICSIRTTTQLHKPTLTKHRKEVINALPDGEAFPTQLLKILPFEESELIEVICKQHNTNSGIKVIKEGKPLTQRFVVDLETIKERSLLNHKTNKPEKIKTILEVHGNVLPLEILEFIKEEYKGGSYGL